MPAAVARCMGSSVGVVWVVVSGRHVQARNWLDVRPDAGWRGERTSTTLQFQLENGEAKHAAFHAVVSGHAHMSTHICHCVQTPLATVEFFHPLRIIPDIMHIIDLAVAPWFIACVLVDVAPLPYCSGCMRAA